MSALLPLFSDKLIPWAKSDLAQRLIVARPVMEKKAMPYGVEITQRKISGKRVIVRNRRDFDNQRLFLAEWPEAGLHELAIPKLICVTNGTTDFQVGEYIITCSEGHFILLPPRTPVTCMGHSHLEGERRQSGSCDLLQILPFRNNIQCWPCHSRGEQHYNDPANHCLVRHPPAAQLFKLFVEQALMNEEGCIPICEYLLPGFLSLLAREIKSERSMGLLANTPEDSATAQSVQEIRDYIKAHLNQSLTIEKVARHVYMSPAQFTRYLRRETGHSFVEMLTEYRLEEAKFLLQGTELSISFISELVGFKSATYFNDFFRRSVGCTPGNFRKSKNESKYERK